MSARIWNKHRLSIIIGRSSSLQLEPMSGWFRWSRISRNQEQSWRTWINVVFYSDRYDQRTLKLSYFDKRCNCNFKTSKAILMIIFLCPA